MDSSTGQAPSTGSGQAPSTGSGQGDDFDPDDAELAALLDFEPVPRRVSRENGWSAENQRAFIALLVETGNYRIAAQRLGLTASGVYQLRKDAGAEDFSRAWDEAVALHKARNPRPAARPARELRAAGARRAGGDELEPSEAEQLLEAILKRYLLKLRQERQCRLAGRIVEADFYVRQLTFLEIVLDIGGKTQALLETLKAGDTELLQVAATPGSALLEKARRGLWLEQGEADRPPPARLGARDGERATGEPTDYNAARDGDFREWERRRADARALAAEAQAEWEDRARREAEGRAGNDRPASDSEPAPDPAP